MRWSADDLAEYNKRRGIVPGAANAVATSPQPFLPPIANDGSEPVTISLTGAPMGKGRARAFIRAGHVAHYTPEKTRSYEGMIRTAAMDAMGNRPPIDQPVEFVMRAIFDVPTSWSQKKRTAALLGDIKPGKKPDLDNIAKAWWDALNGVVYRDDSLIVKATFEKRYGPQALVVATVRAA